MNINDIQALLNQTATIKTKLNVLAVGSLPALTLTEENSVKKWEYNDLRYVEDEGIIGQFVARSLSGELHNISDDFNIENREIQLQLGIVRPSGSTFVTTYYTLGNFIVDKPNDDNVADNTKFEALDYTIYFNKQFNGDYIDATYTMSFNDLMSNGSAVTAKWLAQYTCKQCGVILGSSSFTNDDFAITSNQFDSIDTCRDVIKAIAKLAYSWARIGWDNKLYFDFTVQTQASVETYNVIDNDLYYSLSTQKNNYGPVNKVVIASSIVSGDEVSVEDSASIALHGLHELDIYDNPILNTDELKQLAIENGDVLFNLEYTPLEMETTGHPWLLGNELIKVKDMENVDRYTYPLNRTITFEGHIKTKIVSIAQTDVEKEYTYNGSSNVGKVTRILLDKQEGTIQSLVVDNEEMTSKISSVEQSNASINTTVMSLKNGYYAYNLTTDTRFANAKEYYELWQGDYEQLEYNSTTQTYTSNDGTVYHVNDLIPSERIYVKGDFIEGVDGLRTQISTIEGTFEQRTNNSITQWFATTNISGDLADLKDRLGSAEDILDLYQSYIKDGIDTNVPKITTDTTYQPNKRYFTKSGNNYIELVRGTDYNVGDPITGTKYESLHYSDAYIEIGAVTNNTKIRIYPSEVVFLSGEERTAYISNNALYIEQSTILTTEQIGHWITVEDDVGNLNTKWVGE